MQWKLQTYRADTITLNSKNPDFMIDGEHFGMEKSLYELYERHILMWSGTKSYSIMQRSIEIDVFQHLLIKSC